MFRKKISLPLLSQQKPSLYVEGKEAKGMVLEFREMVEVETAYGKGYIWYMMDYGPNSDTLYTVIIKETGECWQMCHKDFRVCTNTSLGIRGKYENPKPTSALSESTGLKRN